MAIGVETRTFVMLGGGSNAGKVLIGNTGDPCNCECTICAGCCTHYIIHVFGQPDGCLPDDLDPRIVDRFPTFDGVFPCDGSRYSCDWAIENFSETIYGDCTKASTNGHRWQVGINACADCAGTLITTLPTFISDASGQCPPATGWVLDPDDPNNFPDACPDLNSGLSVSVECADNPLPGGMAMGGLYPISMGMM